VERDEHLAAHLIPAGDLLVGEPDAVGQRLAATLGQQAEHLPGGLGDPGHHDVRVGVVAQPALGRVRILLVELVRAHDAVDLVAVPVRVEAGDRGPEARDLQHHLGAVLAQEVEVLGGLVVAPDVVEDRGVDVPLVVAEVRLPAARQWVEVDDLRLFPAVAAALPRVHRAPVAGLARGGPGLAETSEAVHQQRAGDIGKAEVQEGIDIELVPEDVPAIGLAVEASRRDTGVPVGRVARTDLQDVGNVEAQQELDAIVPRQPHVARTPQLIPGPFVTLERLGEPGIATGGRPRAPQRFADGAVA
jgi:hypothetical protein